MLRERGFYEKYVKRILDIVSAMLAILVFGWLYVLIALLVLIKLGKPILFKQPRPGLIDPETGRESLFYMLKFRSMSNACDENGKLLPDEQRLSCFGRLLRATSLDELPEVFNILKGDMSVIGPRPQLVRDMVFMTDEQRMRHSATPGLSGLAQVMGRNSISWEEKLDWDLKYIQKVSFVEDMKILWLTIKQLFQWFRAKNRASVDVTSDYGDALLANGNITREEYDQLQKKAIAFLENAHERSR